MRLHIVTYRSTLHPIGFAIQAVAIFKEMISFRRLSQWGAFCLLFSSWAHAEFYIHGFEDQHETSGAFRLAPEIGFYSTNQNYDAKGTAAAVSGLDSYKRTSVEALGAYGLSPRVTAFGRLNWTKATVNGPGAGSTYGLADQTLGLNFTAWQSADTVKPWRLDIQAELDLPAYNDNTNYTEGTPFLGDGSTDFTLGGFLVGVLGSSKTSVWKLEAGLGYSKRGNDFSSALPWSARLRAEWPESKLALAFGLQGYSSLSNDKLTPHLGTGAGGSAFINAVNPSVINFRIDPSYLLNPSTSIGAFVLKSATGKNSPSGFAAGINAVFRLSDGTANSASSAASNNTGFVDYHPLEAHVVRTNDKLNLIKIDKGSLDGIRVGQVFDIFSVKNGSANEAIARGECTAVKPSEAALQVKEYYKEVWIDQGFIVKRPLQ